MHNPLQLKTRWALLLVLLAFAPVSDARTQTNSTPPKIYRDKVEPHWFAGADGVTNRFWYHVSICRMENMKPSR